MHCPNCGAALVVTPFCEVAECDHCSSTHVLLPPAVGNERIVWGDEPTGVNCPRCGGGLLHAVLDGHSAQACPDCHGVLLSNGAFGAIVRHRRAKYQGEAVVPRPIDLDLLSDPVYCPHCRWTMEVHPYYGPGNQIIDSCARCGLVWVDSGELTSIERAPGTR